MIRLEQPVCLAIWKDLNKGQEKNREIRFHGQNRDNVKKKQSLKSDCFFDAGHRAFGALAYA